MSNAIKQPRLDDVATLAGVSTATVSRFINSPAMVAAGTGDRIRAAIAQTGYVPNLIAGGLATSRSGLVAALIPDMGPSVFGDTIEAMVQALSEDQQIVMIGLTGHDFVRWNTLIDAALARRADAIILTGTPNDDAIRARLRARPVTVIETWGLPDDPIDVAVGFSHVAAGTEVARFAVGRGYRRAHLLSTNGPRARERRDGFRAAWLAAGLPEPTEELFPTPTRFGHGRAAFRGIRHLPVAPDLVVCSSDWIAQGLIVEASAAGVRMPDQLAVIGFGNLAVAAEMRPTITTIDIDGARIGREAIALLRRRAAGETITKRHVDVGFRLIVRESA